MSSSWRLRRTKQCTSCPWRVDVDPEQDIPIPDYSVEKHQALKSTIAEPGRVELHGLHAMSCHEALEGEEYHCLGWLANQAGPGNNIALRMQLLSCENIHELELVGDQRKRFEDTLPPGA